MSSTPLIIRDSFAYTNNSLYAEASNQNRHRRATLPELQALFHPPAHTSSSVDKDPVGHWYEAQLLHYGLPTSKSKAVAKTRLLDAVNRGGLTVPAHIQKIETELKKEWLKRNRAFKESQSQQTTVESPAQKGKRKRTEQDDAAKKTPKRNVKQNNIPSKVQKAKPESAATPLATEQTAIYSGPPRGGASVRGKATATSGRSRGRGSTRSKENSSGPSRAIFHHTKQTARRSRGKSWARGSLTTRPQHQPFTTESDGEDGAYAQKFFDSSNNPGGFGWEASMDFKEESGNDLVSELLPLGLLNGMYEIRSEDLDDWEMFDGDEFSLILCLDGNGLWGAYNFGMYSGIMYLSDRPRTSSYDHIPFTWRGRENSENTISFSSDNEGWIQFLGGGSIKGMINCYREALFTGYRLSGNDSKAPRDARSMRAEWEGYNSEEYERAMRARWGGYG